MGLGVAHVGATVLPRPSVLTLALDRRSIVYRSQWLFNPAFAGSTQSSI